MDSIYRQYSTAELIDMLDSITSASTREAIIKVIERRRKAKEGK